MLSLPPLAAETLFHIGSFPVSNSYVNSSLGVAVFAVFAFFLNRSAGKYYANDKTADESARYTGKAPRGLVNFFESILEFVLGYIDGVTKNRKKTMRFLPIVGAMFFFILFSINILMFVSLLPFGEAGRGILYPKGFTASASSACIWIIKYKTFSV